MMKSILLALAFATTALAGTPAERFPTVDNAPLSWSTGPYSYDAAGNVTAIGSQYFLYDATSRITTGHVTTLNAAVTQTYAYDPYGNMTSLAGYGPDQLLTADPSTNHLSVGSALYDVAGNLTQWQPPGTAVLYKYDYDAAGMMTRLRTGPDTNPYTVTYVYTPNDQRLWTADLSANDSHFTIRGLGGAVLSDFELKGTAWSLTRDYFYRGSGVMTAAASSGGVQYDSLDHLGSPRLLTDDGGLVLGFQTFLPYGQEISPKPVADGAVKKFTGHERDADPAGIGNPLDYMHARFYNGLAGRFLSFDPALDPKASIASPGLWNRYSYVSGNPVIRIDPSGLYQINCGDAKDPKLCGQLATNFKASLNMARFSENTAAWKAMAAYGKEGEAGVVVTFGATPQNTPANTTVEKTVITDFRGASDGHLTPGPHSPLLGDITVQFRGANDINEVNVAHEGVHIEQVRHFTETGERLARYHNEYAAYLVSAEVGKKLNLNVDTPTFRITPDMSQQAVGMIINKILAAPPYNVTPQSPGDVWP